VTRRPGSEKSLAFFVALSNQHSALSRGRFTAKDAKIAKEAGRRRLAQMNADQKKKIL
jgi:hypothetical protein